MRVKMFSEKDLQKVFVFDTTPYTGRIRYEDIRVPKETRRKPEISRPKKGGS